MTKIYLVKATYINEKESYQECNLQVFTNFRKAKIYQEFKTLQYEQGALIFPKKKEVSFKIEKMTISNIDWSEELNDLQIRNLPY